MRIINAFFLALFIYSAIIFGFVYFLLLKNKAPKTKTVYVHQAIFVKDTQKNVLKEKQKTVLKKEQKLSTNKKIEVKTKDDFSKGGKDIKLDDIFSSVSDNIPTTKIQQKKQKNMTKKVGDTTLQEVRKQFKNLKMSSNISSVVGSNNDSKYIQNEFSRVWSEIDTNAGDFIKIDINIQNGIVNVVVIATNLDTIRLNQFLNNIKSINTSKIQNFKAIIDFKSELKD